MPVSVHADEPRFLFFWNHKVASRSILQALGAEFPALRVYPQSSFRPWRDDRDWRRFMVVRNPWARVASCYRNKCRDAVEGLARNGSLEPCQHHLLRALGAWPSHRGWSGARRLSDLGFDEFVALLPGVRDGNSHFRLQVDVLRDAGPTTSRVAWVGRAAGTLLHLGLTHYQTPPILKRGLEPARDAETLSRARTQAVRWIRLEDLPDSWTEVEEALGRAVPLPWNVKTSTGDDWRGLYDRSLTAQVATLYAPDIELFGYEDAAP